MAEILTNTGELSRLISAAVVNREFCKLLLTEPKQALAAGYKGETFQLTPEEYRLVLSIQAKSLADFATQLTKNRNDNSNPYAYKGNGNGHGNGNGNSHGSGNGHGHGNGKQHNNGHSGQGSNLWEKWLA